jgi:hypothetical protein
MSRISKITWDDGRGIEDLINAGIEPLRYFSDYLALCGEDGQRVGVIAGHFEDMLEEIEECLHRFLDDCKKTGCPDAGTSEQP